MASNYTSNFCGLLRISELYAGLDWDKMVSGDQMLYVQEREEVKCKEIHTVI